MNKKKPYSVKVTKAYEQGKEDALAYRKLNPQVSPWVQFLSVISNSGLKKKYVDSYRIGYFEVVNGRKKQEGLERASLDRTQRETQASQELVKIDKYIEELGIRKKAILDSKKRKETIKDNQFEK